MFFRFVPPTSAMLTAGPPQIRVGQLRAHWTGKNWRLSEDFFIGLTGKTTIPTNQKLK